MRERIVTLLKNKWLYVVVLGLASLVGGGAYSDKITELLLKLLGAK